jgi:Bucentaur or craniofacial development
VPEDLSSAAAPAPVKSVPDTMKAAESPPPVSTARALCRTPAMSSGARSMSPQSRPERTKPASIPLDDIWAQMNQPIKRRLAERGGVKKKSDSAMAGWLGLSKPATKPAAKRTAASATDKALSSWIGDGLASGSGAPCGSGAPSGSASASVLAATGGSSSDKTTVKVVRLDDVLKAGKEKEEAVEEEEHKKKKGGTGLEDILSAIKGPKQAGVLDRTREAWTGLKASDADVAEELNAYKKDKNRYTDKVAFLERTDKREWEADMERKRKR